MMTCDFTVNSCNLIDNITSLNTFLTEFDSEVSEKLEFTTKSDLDTSCQKVKVNRGGYTV